MSLNELTEKKFTLTCISLWTQNKVEWVIQYIGYAFKTNIMKACTVLLKKKMNKETKNNLE